MGKEWTVIRTDRTNGVEKKEAVRKANVAKKVIKGTTSLSYEKLQEEGIEAHKAVIAREDSLLAAKTDKKLKSETLIKEAKAIEKRREKNKNKKKGKAKDKAE
jgi:hypothetical protein